MTRISFRPFPTRVRLDRVLTTSALALVLTTLPIGVDAGAPVLHWQAAFAKSDGGGGGGAGGGGGGQGGGGVGGEHGKGPGERGGPDGVPGSRGHAYGRDAAQGGGQGYHDLNEFLDSVRNGKALGLERRDERVEQAQGRYAAALGKADQARPDEGAVGPAAHRFSAEETEALMARGWKGPAARDAGFRNHGERVSTMVELSKRLGYGAHVGALQANFGTPQENGIAALEAELAEAEAAGDLVAMERLEAELAEAIANAKPGNGPDDSWATADLDVNDDGVVDRGDLEALEQSEAGVDATGDSSAS